MRRPEPWRGRSFLLCALPRSRTAWLANFLTAGGVRCGHELSAEVGSPEELVMRLRTVGGEARYVGNADTGQVLMLPRLLELMPEARLVIVQREKSEVVESLRRLGLRRAEEVLGALAFALEAAARRPEALAVKYEDLAREETGRAVLEWVAPGERFDAERWRMLQGMNVQVTPRRLEELVGGDALR